MVSDRFSNKPTGLSPAQLALLRQRLKGRGAGAAVAPAIPRRAVRETAPLSFIQQEALHVTQTEDVPPSYLGTALHYFGDLDLRALRESVTEATRRHESLRTALVTTDGVTAQVISPPAPADVALTDISELPAAERIAEAQRLAAHELARPFELSQSPLWRVRVFRLDREEHVLTITLHHLIADFISLGLVIQELGALYDAFSNRRPSPLPELQIQYGDWAVWQREQVEGGGLDAQFAYWRERLSGCPPVLELPFARTRPATQTFRGAVRSKLLPATLSDALRELSRKQQVSLYATLLAAFALLVRCYTRREDIVLGRGVTGRTRIELEKMVGCFINLVLMRVDVSGNPTFADLLKRVRAVVEEAYANQDVPFSKLVEDLQPERDANRPPLAQVLFNLYTAPAAPPEIERARFRIFDLGDYRSIHDMALFQDIILGMHDSGNRLMAELKYNRELFAADAMEQVLEDYRILLETIVTAPEQHIQELTRRAGIACSQPES
ncbi:MAG TPA: condensation domain-containing protein [Pyrinomonadaceae bacterium]|nr:condensation domain-containing protein [Pyrinomonadaceae bacterium]